MREYQYTPLDVATGEIRLLELQPGAFDDPVSISIYAVPLAAPQQELVPIDRLEAIRQTLPPDWAAWETIDDRVIFWNSVQDRTSWTHPDPNYVYTPWTSEEDLVEMCCPKFEALSYTWGLPESQQSIINVAPSTNIGIEREPTLNNEVTALTVQSNLFDALRHLRAREASRLLWIDAISINQNDVSERSQQVQRMGDVFKCAHRVVVWLGVASSTTSLAMSTLSRVADQIEHTKDAYRLASPNCTSKDLFQSYDASSIDSDSATWHAVYELIQRPWFYRLWVVQEVRLAAASSLVQCGNDTMAWSQLRRAIITGCSLRFPPGSPRGLMNRFSHMRHLTPFHHHEEPLTLLLHAFRLKCSDSRDKIFGLLGLLPPVLSEKIQPDYTQSVRQIHHRAITAYVESTGDLNILTTAGPSWLPIWSTSRAMFGWGGLYCSGQSSANIAYPAPDVLQATGVSEDTVQFCLKPHSNTHDSAMEAIRSLWLRDASLGAHYPTGETLTEACAWTLNAGVLRDRWTVARHLYRTLAEALAPILSTQDNGAPRPQGDLMAGSSLNRNFLFRTRKGYFGRSFNEVRPGDKVSVLLGCSLPALMREQSDGQNLFVGCAYIHGLMDGEALLGPLPKECSVRILADRNGEAQQNFFNSTTEEWSLSDPRLDPLPSAWEEYLAPDRLWPTARKFNAFRNKDTGEIMYSDPRMLPDALRARGVPLQEFLLV